MNTETKQENTQEEGRYDGPGALIYLIIAFLVILLIANIEGWTIEGWSYYNYKLIQSENTGLTSLIGKTILKIWCNILFWLASYRIASIITLLLTSILMYLCLLGIKRFKRLWLRIPAIGLMVVFTLLFLLQIVLNFFSTPENESISSGSQEIQFKPSENPEETPNHQNVNQLPEATDAEVDRIIDKAFNNSSEESSIDWEQLTTDNDRENYQGYGKLYDLSGNLIAYYDDGKMSYQRNGSNEFAYLSGDKIYTKSKSAGSDQVGIFKNGVIYSSFVDERKIVAYYRNGVVYRVDRYGAQQPIAKYEGVDYTGIMAAITTGLIPE